MIFCFKARLRMDKSFSTEDRNQRVEDIMIEVIRPIDSIFEISNKLFTCLFHLA